LYLLIPVGKLKERDHFEDFGVDESIVDDVDWIPVAHDRVQWQTLEDKVMSLRVP
jgi:hypothetical protein